MSEHLLFSSPTDHQYAAVLMNNYLLNKKVVNIFIRLLYEVGSLHIFFSFGDVSRESQILPGVSFEDITYSTLHFARFLVYSFLEKIGNSIVNYLHLIITRLGLLHAISSLQNVAHQSVANSWIWDAT